jgi:putative NADPH-quinone reductase
MAGARGFGRHADGLRRRLLLAARRRVERRGGRGGAIMADVRRILILQGHPDPSAVHFGHALADAYGRGAGAGGHVVETIEIAKLEFPSVRSRDDVERSVTPPDIRAVQEALRRADHVVLVFPIWNGGAPARLRAFFEQTFRPGFVFPDLKPGERIGFSAAIARHKALTGKTARIVTTMQMPAVIYRWYFRPHLEKNAFRLSGLGPVRETLVGLVESPQSGRRERWLRAVYDLGRAGR